ncbi:hypothetical protein XA68_18390 [Ophiocordyceps unilateralis]|uniref:Alpha/beta hydrolase fold-3 domain-containing protein n=1 Tax=Ophiocordyceps unilateralis TaxID=268505 RepID=A0A2A9PHP5_OPHUN|nr:hypothetical protein XA68_18390 [Ophiocordyceps unilateralis]
MRANPSPRRRARHGWAGSGNSTSRRLDPSQGRIPAYIAIRAPRIPSTPAMILGPVSASDCLVFCILLAPQLIWHVGLVRTTCVVLKALPFLLLQLPLDLVRHRLWLPASSTLAFARESSTFEYVVSRCVRYSFKHIPPEVARVFFFKMICLPYLRWRMLRHGLVECPVHWYEHVHREGDTAVEGLWVRHDPNRSPDLVIYYIHGGGFSMGSSYFYLEFLMAWVHLLLDAGFENPAVFAPNYTLVPEAGYPTQLFDVVCGYDHVLQVAGDASRVCVAGDSAGSTLALGLLLKIGAQAQESCGLGIRMDASPVRPVPLMAALISPWVKLKSDAHYPSEMDYLDPQTLWKYAHAYAGESMLNQYPASPGSCTDDKLWKAAAPQCGYIVVFGEVEVFAPDIESFISCQARNGVDVKTLRFDGGIHAWPVASLFISRTVDRRLQGLRYLAGQISRLAKSDAAVVSGAAKEALRLDQVDRHALAE